jgi:hypothetical protein
VPLRWGTWVRLAALGLATGELGSSGACNFPGFPAPAGAPGHRTGQLLSVLPHLPPRLGLGPLQFALLVGTVVVLSIIAGVVALYVASVCRFVLFESVLTGRYSLRPGWRRWQPQGERLFFFNLAVVLSGIAIFGLLIALPVLIAVTHGIRTRTMPLAPMLVSIFLLVMVGGVVALGLLLVHVLTKDFVVPQMAFEQLGPVVAWRRLFAIIERDRAGYAGYLGMKIVLAIASAVIFGVLSLLLVLVITIPVVLVVVIVALAGHASPALIWNPFALTLAVLLGCLGFALLMFLVALVHAPATAFFTAYSMHFFASRYPALAAVLYLAPPPGLQPATPAT